MTGAHAWSPSGVPSAQSSVCHQTAPPRTAERVAQHGNSMHSCNVQRAGQDRCCLPCWQRRVSMIRSSFKTSAPRDTTCSNTRWWCAVHKGILLKHTRVHAAHICICTLAIPLHVGESDGMCMLVVMQLHTSRWEVHLHRQVAAAHLHMPCGLA
jgi:hypothetical protein